MKCYLAVDIGASSGRHIVGYVKDGKIAIKGWIETSEITLEDFLLRMTELGVKTVICTDISKDGAESGTNLELYSSLSKKYAIDIIASGGVSSISDIEALRRMDLYGAIIGKAYYTGAIKLEEALEVAK
jgi:phosphoribosylformimino-5-aminoimidazole carboxamide ribotide isomerase